MAVEDYQIVVSKRRKTAAIKVTERGVEVRVPPYISKQWLDEWLAEKAPWIEKQQFRLQQTISESCLNLQQGSSWPYRGNSLTVRWYSAKRSDLLEVDDALTIYYGSRVRNIEGYVVKQLKSWYREKAEFYLSERIHSHAKRMRLSFNDLIIKDFKRRWGSCNSVGVISLNWRLIFAEENLIDYVLIHELAHLVHLNHQAEFWHLVAQYHPDWRTSRKELMRKVGWLLW